MRLFDSDTCIAILRGKEPVLQNRARNDGEVVATTWITASELLYGAAKSQRPEHHREQVRAFLQTLPLLPWKESVAERFGKLKAVLEAKGERLADADLWIAAFTIEYGAVLVTGNTRHFARIQGLPVENWM